MHIKTIEDERVRSFRSHKRKKLLASLILAFVGVAGLAAWAIANAISPTGSDIATISYETKGYDGEMNDDDIYKLFYGINPNHTSQTWATKWYVIKFGNTLSDLNNHVNEHDAVCIEPPKQDASTGIHIDPNQTGATVSELTGSTYNDLKKVLLVTVPSYSNSSSGSPNNYYNLFSSYLNSNYTNGVKSGWELVAENVTCVKVIDQSHCSVPYNGEYYDYNRKGHPTREEYIYIFGHILAGRFYTGQYDNLRSGNAAELNNLKTYIDRFFAQSQYANAIDDFHLFTARHATDSSKQRIAWLEYEQSSISARIKIRKVDSETGNPTNGDYTVAGTVFSVLNSSNVEVATITIGSNGIGTSGVITKPDTYKVVEKSVPAGSGYKTNSSSITVMIDRADDGKTFDLSGSTTTVCRGQSFTYGSGSCRFVNTLIRGGVSLKKVRNVFTANAGGTSTSTSTPAFADIVFNVYKRSDLTNPVGIITTDSNGNGSLGNLPYGDYRLVEQPGVNNSAYAMISADFTIATDGTTVNLGTKTNTTPDNPNIHTVARNSNSTSSDPDKELEISANASLTDRVTNCSGLSPNYEYRITGKLYTMDNTELASTSTVDFTSTAAGGCDPFDMVFSPTINTAQYIDSYLGVKQFLYKKNGSEWLLIGIHNKDLSDNDQRIKVKNITIATSAISTRNANNKILAAGRVKIIDGYSIIGLTNGQTYTLKGYVKDGATTVANNTATINMTLATGATYTGSMEFEFDSTPYVGKDLTVVQELYVSGSDTPIITHVASDDSQTVNVITPTLATDAVNNKDTSSKELEVGHIDAAGSPTIKDTVTYTGLAPGSTYTIKGEVLKLDGNGDATGTAIASKTHSFTASTEDGSETLTFDIDTISNCAVNNILTLPCKFVVYEYIYYGNGTSPFAKHEDARDNKQIVSVKTPAITTAASDIQNDTKHLPVGTTTVLDRVTYTNLTPGQTFILEGKLIDLETGNIIRNSANEDITAIDSFVAASDSATVAIDNFKKFDTTLHYDYTKGENQKKYVVHQTLKSGDVVLYTHAENTDENQTVQIGVPKMVTSATYKRDGSHLLGVGDVTMKDYVDYEGLVEGEWYMIVGTMVDPETGTPVEINDEFVRNSKTFKAGADGKGTVELEINLNTISIQGRKFVVHERLYRSEDKHGDGRILAVHEPDIDEDDQTITVKKATIGTVASDKADGDNVLNYEENQTIVDKVHYDGLLMDEKYTLYGYLYDKTNDEPLKDANDNLITASAAFTTSAREDNGDIEMEFPVNATDLPGVEIVVFEYLFQGETVPTKEDGTVDLDQKVTEHADKEDPGQTVKVSMRIGTTAADSYDGDQIIGVGKVQVIDNLQYEGASAGKTYKAKGWLVYKADSDEHHAGDKVSSPVITCIIDDETDYDEGDDEDDEEYDGDGDDEEGEEESEEKDEEEPTRTCTRDWVEVEAEETFTIGSEDHEDTSGVATIEFEFDSRELIGQKLVVFEELYLIDDEGREELVAEHKNLEDSNQTITVATPTIHTIASDKADGDKELANDAEATIVDKVEYTGLVADTTYTLHGVLVDKNSGERVSGGLTEITWTFTPTRDAGVEELEFTINTTGLSGKEIVAFETLYIDDAVDEENWIAEHKDLNDDSQTVWVKVNKPNTGLFAHSMEEARLVNLYTTIGGLAVASISIWFAYRYAKHRKIRQF
ncbi:VaFE repeat-containing surface-anchored protein [Candidatus Saccharibacteria bacterium]|nr:VaFE repeat-containing surface-anchored protein [Candidatus Saccharibacteria bacterium]